MLGSNVFHGQLDTIKKINYKEAFETLVDYVKQVKDLIQPVISGRIRKVN